MIIRKKEIAKTLFYVGIGIYLMGTIPLLGYFVIFIGGWNLINIFKKKYPILSVRNGHCYHCEQHKVSIILYDTPEGKVYESFCGHCKRKGEGTSR